MIRLVRERLGATAAAGPLLYVEGHNGIALGEEVVIRLHDGTGRRGQVIDAGLSATVIQLLDDPAGVAPGTARLTFAGRSAEAVVGRDLLGRVLSGAGDPLDGLPPPLGEAIRPLWGAPLNPVRRECPSAPIETGISTIDGLNTLVRGQKLPIFSGAGLPGLDLAARIVADARLPGDAPFAVVFVGMGIPDRDAARFIRRFAGTPAMARSTFFLNRAGDPPIERLRAPRLALTLAEALAEAAGLDVLVVMADVTHYCEALRELGAAREEIPGRRGYPGYLYSDLASLFERAGVRRGAAGSVTQLPILSMPDDDITHPIPDLTGYITEGQVVLSRELHRWGVDPPVDVLPSLSRLMGHAIGEATDPDHRAWADQLYATYALGREARLTAAIVGEGGLPPEERRALGFADRFEREFVHQAERRSLAETMAAGWSLLASLPRSDLVKLPDAVAGRRLASGAGP